MTTDLIVFFCIMIAVGYVAHRIGYKRGYAQGRIDAVPDYYSE
jgi:hypothetical protein